MSQEPTANVNGVHPGKTSQISLGSNQTGSDSVMPSDENQRSISDTVPSGLTRPPHSLRQASTNQFPERPKASSWLTNGNHGFGETNNDIASNMPELDHRDNWQMRHGWEDQYNSEEYLSLLSSVSS